MRRTYLVAIVLILVLAFAFGCSQSQPQEVDFVKMCYNEKPDRSGLPLSQIEMLYVGVKKADDSSARQTLMENCPNAATNFLDQ